MIPRHRYKVTVRIKVHTSPLRELEYDKEGVFIRETRSYYVFTGFRLHKNTVVNIVELSEGYR